jgi:hypothetical protein
MIAREDRVGRSNPEIQLVRNSLAEVERAVRRLAASLNGRPGSHAAPHRIVLSPKRRTALALHGRYLGHIRHLDPAQKAKVKAEKAKRGYRAAIALAKRLSGR